MQCLYGVWCHVSKIGNTLNASHLPCRPRVRVQHGAIMAMKAPYPYVWMLVAVTLMCGCNSPLLSRKTPEPDEEEVLGDRVTLVADAAISYGREAIRVEGVGLVVGLKGTGSDPIPSPYRSMLLDEMKKRGVEHPERVLARSDTALAIVRGFLKGGVQKGDRFDVEIRVPGRSETESLRGGFLLETRLKETLVVGGEVHDGTPLAMAKGAILVDATNDTDEEQKPLLVRGRVLGGGVSLKERSLGLLLKPDYQTFRDSSQVGHAINQRFHTFHNGNKDELAKPKTYEFVDLKVHPRYKDNIARYLNVVRSLPIRESATERNARIRLLQRQLLDPLASANAALRLEAIGKQGVPVLLEGVQSDEPEVRFFAAESLAYLDAEESGQAAEALADAARSVRAFRVFALTALSSMNNLEAHDQLRQLLHEKSAETRYGAFRALWAMNSQDPLVHGESLGDQFSYHTLSTTGTPLVHATLSYRPEIVLFGHDVQLLTPLVLEAGTNILLQAPAGGPITISRFAVGESDQKREVSTKLDDIIRNVVDLGATYPDVVQMLQQTQQKNLLPENCRFEIDAVPRPGRSYRRKGNEAEEGEDGPSYSVPGALPDLFEGLSTSEDETPRRPRTPKADEEKKEGVLKDFFDRIGGG